MPWGEAVKLELVSASPRSGGSMEVAMKNHLGMMALIVMLSAALTACAGYGDRTAATEEENKPGLQPMTAQEKKVSQEQLDRRNLEERQRLAAPSRMEKVEVPPYTENKPIGGQAEAGSTDFPQPAFPFVKGELVQIEGEFYTVRDAEGKEVRVHVDKRTNLESAFHVGDKVEVHRTLQGHALSVKKASTPMMGAASSSSSGAGASSGQKIVGTEQVTLGGARQAVRGDVLRIDGEKYVIRDGHGNEVRMTVNQNTRMFCPGGSVASLMPDPSASDKPGLTGQPQDLSLTAEQKGSEVGPGTKKAAGEGMSTGCGFSVGDKVEAEISDMGVATFIKPAGRPQPGQPLP
jgi:hypothetical protein